MFSPISWYVPYFPRPLFSPPRTQGEPGHKKAVAERSHFGTWSPKMYHEHGDTPFHSFLDLGES